MNDLELIAIPRGRLSMLAGHRVTGVRRDDGDYVLECVDEDTGRRGIAEIGFRNGSRPGGLHVVIRREETE